MTHEAHACSHAATLYHIEARYTEARFNPLARDPCLSKASTGHQLTAPSKCQARTRNTKVLAPSIPPKRWKDGIRTASVAQSARAGFQASPCLGKSWQVLALISDSPSLTTEKGEFSRGTVCDGGEGDRSD